MRQKKRGQQFSKKPRQDEIRQQEILSDEIRSFIVDADEKKEIKSVDADEMKERKSESNKMKTRFFK